MVRTPTTIPSSKHLFLGTGLVFFAMNFMIGGWLSRLPDLQARLSLSEGQLGIALLGLPAGAFLGNLLSAPLLKRYPLGRVTFIAIHVMMSFMVIMSLTNSLFTLLIGLLWVGLADGLTNVSMNTTADTIERQYHIRIMSSCHGMFSLGGFAGALIGGIAASLHCPLPWQLAGQLIVLTLVLHSLKRYVWPVTANRSTRSFPTSSLSKLEKKQLIIPAIIGFSIMIGEGAISDWSPLFMREERGSSPLVAAMAYGGFSLFMAIGRFRGDYIRQRIESSLLLMTGASIGFFGLLLAIVVPWSATSVLGFSLAGLGFSVVVPVLFSMAANLAQNRPDQGIAFIANTGIVGFLMAPPAIGFLAEHFGLGIALSTVLILSLIALIHAWLLRRQTIQ